MRRSVLDFVRRWTLRADWGLLLALALAFFAAAPFLSRPGLPHQTDAELHVYRAAELGHVLRAGVFYPRWAPDFYFGYGYPIFNYYAPMTYYLANLFDLVPGVDIVGGVKAVFVLGLVVASVGTYLLGRELFGPAAGVLAAASFSFAPYVVFIDPHARGDLAEHFAVCLLPLALYAFHCLMTGAGGRGALLGSVLTLAALVFSHNLLGPVSCGLLLGYWAWESAFGVGRRRARWGLLAFALAAAIVAFFWLPALWERDAIKLRVIGPGHFDFHQHFLSLHELLAPSRIMDLGATAPRYRFNLGLAQWLLALPVLGALLHPEVRRRRVLAYVAPVGLGLMFLTLPASTAVWERVPLLEYLQFPWRLLGPTNLMLAICASGGMILLPDGRWRNAALAGGLAMILILALPVLYPPTWAPDFGGTAPSDIVQWEQDSLALGTTSTGDFLPVEAAMAPIRPARTMLESYSTPGPVDRVNRATLPEGATVGIVENGPLHDRLAVSTPEKFVLRVYTFYFPGWQAYVDGEGVEIEVAGPEGFITLRVPEGEHEVLVRFEDTVPRKTGWVVSALGLGVLVAALVLMESSHVRVLNGSKGLAAIRAHCSRLDLGTAAWLGGALAFVVVVKNVAVDAHDNWLRCTSPPGQAWSAQHELQVNFGGQIELLGYDLSERSVSSGEEFPVVLYWHGLRQLGTNYQSFVHLARPLNVLWGQEDHLNPGELPTTRWPLGKYVWDEYEVRVLPGTPPGEYLVNVGLYSAAEGYRLQRYDERGQIVGDSVVLGSVEVVRPRRQPRLCELDMAREVMVRFPEGGLTLLGYSQPSNQVSLPGNWRLTLFWRAERDGPGARVRDLVLLDAEGEEAWRFSGAPAGGSYPFKTWQAGEVVRDPLTLALAESASLEPGVYRVGVTVTTDEPLIPEKNERPIVPLGALELLAGE